MKYNIKDILIQVVFQIRGNYERWGGESAM